LPELQRKGFMAKPKDPVCLLSSEELFRHRVAELEPACRVTVLERQQFLVASHIKPWRNCDNSERLSGANGLLLSPHVDKLFDRHWISRQVLRR